MTPAARVQAAIEILTELQDTARPADRFLRDWFRARRYAGSRDRAAIAERVYDVFRHRASYQWRMRDNTPRALVIASCINDASPDSALDRTFAGGGYGPPPLTEAERKTAAETPPAPGALSVLGEFPDWLEAELQRSLGSDLVSEMQAMSQRAPIDLRANALKTSRDEVLRALRSAGFDADATPYAPCGIRLNPVAGLSALERSDLFLNGAYEFQEEGSQLVARLANAHAGERILDFAAGAGGKALALAADMRNEGEIIAFDKFAERMAPLRARAARAGATIIYQVTEQPAEPSFDLVFIDAPCSGSGAWRRNPDAKWRLTQESLSGYQRTQSGLMDSAAKLVKSGGRLVYVTCSILSCENEDVVNAFLSRNRAFRRVRVDSQWPRLFSTAMPPGSGQDFRATPLKAGTDGFFASIMINS
jgi:16S rRNA (cytosine967-C5)-methyltransferase